jgi:AcrR family transcriptional regulator
MASRKKKAPATTGGDKFANDADRSKADILAVATEEFATYGLSGARVDAIAKRTRTSKRMIYYYFKGKEGLYRAVLEKAYSEIRSIDSQVGLEDVEPVEAIR